MSSRNRAEIPTAKECYEILEETGTLQHIKEHSKKVTCVAKEIAGHLNQAGKKVDAELIVAAALLHDVTKTRSLKTGEDHAETGAELLRQKGYFEISEIVRQHVRLDGEPSNGKITETEIVNYADKRVINRDVVSLQERREYIFRRYAGHYIDTSELEKIWCDTEKIEKKIFAEMPYGPEKLAEKI
jgi:putative nucleotidyltransferase with HDIG domain